MLGAGARTQAFEHADSCIPHTVVFVAQALENPSGVRLRGSEVRVTRESA
jgi:hypothetical protein